VHSLRQRILLSAQAVVVVVALSGIGACGRSGVTTTLTAPVHDTATPFAKGGKKNPPPPPAGGVRLQTFAVTPTSVGGGNPATGSGHLQSPAPTGGAVVTVTSSDAAVHVPASVDVAAGVRDFTFSITTIPVATNHTATVTAGSGGTSLSATLTLVAPALSSVALAPASITAGGTSAGTITLTSPAVAPGAVVTLSSSAPASAGVPASVSIAAGATSATFTVTTPVSAVASSAIITASYNGVSRTATLAVAASDPCKSMNGLGGDVVLTGQKVPQFRTGRLRIDLIGDVPLGWIDKMGACTATAVPAVTIISGTADVTISGTTTSVTSAGGPLTFGALTVPVPLEAGTVLATDAAGDKMQVIWPVLAGLPAAPPTIRVNLASWSAAVTAGIQLDATMSFVARGPDGSTATFTAHGTNMVVPTFVP